MANPDGYPANLKRGENWGNKGGGRESAKVRETKQAFLDSILGRVVGTEDDQAEVSEFVKRQIIADAVSPGADGQVMRRWLFEMQHGKPQSKVEMVVGKPELLHALVHAMHEAGVDADKARAVIEGMRDFIAADPE